MSIKILMKLFFKLKIFQNFEYHAVVKIKVIMGKHKF